MKNIRMLMFLFLVIGFCASCGKDATDLEGEDKDKDPIETFMTAKAGDRDFSSDEANVQIGTPAGSSSEAILIAAHGEIDGVYIGIYDYKGIGTYTHEDNINNYNNIFQYDRLDSVFYAGQWHKLKQVWSTNSGLAGFGSVTITEVTDIYVNGTFSFRGISSTGMNDTIEISVGAFHAKR